MNEDTGATSILFRYIKLKSKQEWTGEQEGGKERCSTCGYCKYLVMSTELSLGRIRLNTSLSRFCALSCSHSLALTHSIFLYVSVSLSNTCSLFLSLSLFSPLSPSISLALSGRLSVSFRLSVSLSLTG